MKETGVYEWPSGRWRITSSNGSITEIRAVVDEVKPGSALTDEAARQLDGWFRGKRKSFDLPIRFAGTGFQRDVLSALMKVGYGRTVTYSELAALSGHPGAVRAVGTALRKNPLQIVIPCHRVVPKSGGHGEYAGGKKLKRFLLELERENSDERL